MRVAVTGSTGFIGRHVLAALAGRPGIDVVCLSRRTVEHSGSDQVTCDIVDPPDALWERSGRPDVLIHLAWSGLPNYRSLHHLETEVPAQYRFLKELANQGLPRMVVAGTCFEYGMMDGELSETMAVEPTNPYGLAKHILHQQLAVARPDIPLAWARLFYMYGEDQAAGSLYPLIKAACRRKDAKFAMSGGEQLRDFLPVEEVARLLVALALDSDTTGPVNICSGNPRSVRALVERWASEETWQPELVLGHFPYPDWEPFAFWGNRAKLDAILSASGTPV